MARLGSFRRPWFGRCNAFASAIVLSLLGIAAAGCSPKVTTVYVYEDAAASADTGNSDAHDGASDAKNDAIFGDSVGPTNDASTGDLGGGAEDGAATGQDGSVSADGTTTADTETSAADDLTQFPLAFVGLAAGPLVVVDRKTMQPLTQIGTGDANCLGSGPLPGQKAVWYGNIPQQALDRYERVGDDPTQWTLTKSVPIAFAPGALSISRNGKIIGLTSGQGASSLGSPFKTDPQISIFNAQTGAVLATLASKAAFAVRIKSDGTVAYFGNWQDHAVTVVDVETLKITAVWPLPVNLAQPNQTGPAGLALSQDDHWLAVCGWESKQISMLDPVTGSSKAANLDGLPYWADFAANDTRLFVTVMPKLPSSMGEGSDVNTVEVFDTATLQQVGKLQWPASLQLVGVPPGSSTIYVVAAQANLLTYDVQTLTNTGQVKLADTFKPASVPNF